jgi:hypothetical protein
VRKRKSTRNDGKPGGQRHSTPERETHSVTMPSKRAIDLTIPPEWEEIEDVRSKTHTYLKDQGLPSEFVDALTMVCSELVENAMKYGCFERPGNTLNFRLHMLERNVIIEVSHPTSASASRHLERLDKTIQWIRGYQDPFQAYLEKLKEVARRPIQDRESGLGLVRIAYEGKSILDFFVADDNALNVSAIAGVGKGLWR